MVGVPPASLNSLQNHVHYIRNASGNLTLMISNNAPAVIAMTSKRIKVDLFCFCYHFVRVERKSYPNCFLLKRATRTDKKT